MILRVYYKDKYEEYEQEKDSFSLGKKRKDDIIIENWALPNSLLISVKDGNFSVVNKNSNNIISKFGEIYYISDDVSISVYERKLNNCQIIDVANNQRIIIGREDNCDIVIKSKLSSRKHLLLYRDNNIWKYRDLNSSNGTYFNGKKSTEGIIGVNDLLTVGFTGFSIINDKLNINSSDTIISKIVSHPKKKVISNGDEYPFVFKKYPRLRSELPTESIEIQNKPSNENNKPSINYLNVLVTPIISVIVTSLVGYYLLGSISMVVISVPMTLIGVVMSIINYKREKKKFSLTSNKIDESYLNYLSEQDDKLKKLSNKMRESLEKDYPSINQNIINSYDLSKTLWDRSIKDNDFLTLRLGTGELPPSFEINVFNQSNMNENGNEVQQLVKKYKSINNCPITVPLYNNPLLGIVGDASKNIKIVKNLIVDATYHHNYEDLHIIVICDKEETEQFEFVKWLPHIYNSDNQTRDIINCKGQESVVLDNLSDVLYQRKIECKEDKGNKAHIYKPFYLFVCTSPNYLLRNKIMEYIDDSENRIGVGGIFAFSDIRMLPDNCNYIIDTNYQKPFFYPKSNISEKTYFSIDNVENAKYEEYARNIAPMKMEIESGNNSFPNNITFLQGYKINNVKDIDLNKNWGCSFPEKSMSVPIGINKNGETFNFDINEKAYGPHGLVAGMTGSGKSEAIQSWILSMAIKFSPSEVSFVLIDFKGTGLILPFRNLPHLAGTISDLDTNINRNLVALENEINKRKAILDKHEVSNISSYLKLYHQGKAKQPLPYLFLIIDEFAEFKVRFPEFMEVIDRIFAIGRTLGIHIILLSQKPSGVIDEKMNANTRFRWCLKVASSSDSKEMLGHSDAAKIVKPGRAYIQVGEDEIYEQIQTFYSGAPYTPYQNDGSLENDVSTVDLYGNRTKCDFEKTTGYRSEKTEADAVVEYIDNYVRTNNIERAKTIWASKLPNTIYLNDVLQIAFDGERWNSVDTSLKPIVGLIDDPRSQSQYPLYINFSDNGHYSVFGAPSSGKTTLLHTTIMSLALSYTPEQVNLYLFDFGGGSLIQFENLPHVGGVATIDSEYYMSDMIEHIKDELNQRKTLFRKNGMLNISSYKELIKDTIPYIVIVIDNYSQGIEVNPEIEDFVNNISREGSNYGIYLLMTTSGVNSIGYRIMQNIKSVISLRLADKNDYSSLVGNLDGIVLENVVGRGLLKGNPVLEFQTALPAFGENEIQRNANINKYIELMANKWKGNKATQVLSMPDRVNLSDYPNSEYLLGVEYKTIAPLYYEIKNLLCCCEDKLWNRLIEAAYNENIICLHSSDEDFDHKILELSIKLDENKEENGKTIIFIDNLKECIEKIQDSTLQILLSISTYGSKYNAFTIVRDNIRNINYLCQIGEGLTNSIVFNSDIFISGKQAVSECEIPNVKISYSEKEIAQEDDGYYYDKKTIRKMKVAR